MVNIRNCAEQNDWRLIVHIDEDLKRATLILYSPLPIKHVTDLLPKFDCPRDICLPVCTIKQCNGGQTDETHPLRLHAKLPSDGNSHRNNNHGNCITAVVHEFPQR